MTLFGTDPDRVALVEAASGRSYTYGELERLARGAITLLEELGAARGDRLVLQLEDRTALAVLYVACLYGGLTAVPVAPSAPAAELEQARERTRARIVVLDWDLGACATAAPAGGAPEDRECLIVFTSGTTSTPKGIVHGTSSLLGAAHGFNEHTGIDADSNFLHVMPMSYMAGILNTLLCPLVAGARVVIAPQFDARSLLDFWRPAVEHGANTLWLSPTMLASIERVDRDPAAAEYCAEHVRAIFSGTAPLTPAVKDRFEAKYGVEILESYGLSEVLFVTSASSRWPRVAGSVGRALGRVEIDFAEDGEIVVRTPFSMLGYLDDGERPTAFATGDLGRSDTDGNVFVTGRKKELIISGGLNVSPRAVEEVLVQHPTVRRAAVLGLPDELLGEEVVAVLELEDGISVDSVRAGLVELCKEHMSSRAVPTRFVSLPSLPSGPTGKVPLDELRRLLRSQP